MIDSGSKGLAKGNRSSDQRPNTRSSTSVLDQKLGGPTNFRVRIPVR